MALKTIQIKTWIGSRRIVETFLVFDEENCLSLPTKWARQEMQDRLADYKAGVCDRSMLVNAVNNYGNQRERDLAILKDQYPQYDWLFYQDWEKFGLLKMKRTMICPIARMVLAQIKSKLSDNNS